MPRHGCSDILFVEHKSTIGFELPSFEIVMIAAQFGASVFHLCPKERKCFPLVNKGLTHIAVACKYKEVSGFIYARPILNNKFSKVDKYIIL